MANVGTAAAGKTLIGAGNGSSPTYASIGTNSGLAAHGVVLAEGNSAFVVATPGVSGTILMSTGVGSDPTFQSGGSIVGNTITGQSGGALPPTAGNWNISGAVTAAGTSPVVTSGAVSTLTVNVQTSQALAAADATKIGLSNFSSAGFGVAATGFVTLATSVPQLFTANTGTATPSSNNLNVLGGGGIQTAGSGATLTIAVSGGGFLWTDVTTTPQAISVQNGYLTDRGGGVSYSLPTTASIGDTFIILGKLGLATITQAASQQILIGSSSSTSGATGTCVSNNIGDSITLVCTTANNIFRATSVIGTWTLN